MREIQFSQQKMLFSKGSAKLPQKTVTLWKPLVYALKARLEREDIL